MGACLRSDRFQKSDTFTSKNIVFVHILYQDAEIMDWQITGSYPEQQHYLCNRAIEGKALALAWRLEQTKYST